jgi:hypothetical protein
LQYTIFALEVAARTERGDPLRAALHGTVLLSSREREAKRFQYRRAAELLSEYFERIDYGCWDYFDDHHRAITDFAMWSDGMLGQEGVRTAPSGDLGPRYLTFTMAFLMARGSPTDRLLAERCEVPEQELWRRDVFASVLATVPLIDFADVRADVAYLIPGADGYALLPADLTGGKFDHLRPLQAP